MLRFPALLRFSADAPLSRIVQETLYRSQIRR